MHRPFRRTRPFLPSLALFLLALGLLPTGRLRGEEPIVGPGPDAATATPADGSADDADASTGDGDANDAAEERKDREEYRDACLAAATLAERHVARIRFTLRKDRGEEPVGARRLQAWGTSRGDIAMAWQDRRPFESPALLVGPDGTLFLPDPLLHPRFIESVTVASDAGEVPGRLAGLLLDTPGLLVVAEGGVPGLEPVTFHEPEQALILPGALLAAGRLLDGATWTTVVEPTGWAFRRDLHRSWVPSHPGMLLLDTKGRPLGYALSNRIREQGGPPWLGADLAGAARIAFADLEAKQRELGDGIRGAALQVRLDFRGLEAEQGSPFRGRHPGAGRGDDPSRNDLLTRGIALTPTRLLVPIGLSRERAARLSRITVWIDDEPLEGTFVGALREHEAFLVDLPEGTGGRPVPDAPPTLAPDGLVLTVRVDYASGARYEAFGWGRWGEPTPGYRGLVTPTVDGMDKPATMVLDPEGRLLGISLLPHREEVEEGPRYYGMEAPRLIPSPLLATLAEAPAEAIDPRIVPLSEREAKRLIWFGIEFQEIDKDLAMQRGVEAITRGGEIGLLITHIYEGSPAAAHDVVAGDILLSVTEEGKAPWEAESEGGGGFHDFFGGIDLDAIPDEIRESMLGQMPAPWPNRRNTLTERLTAMGIGTRATFRILGSEGEREITIDLAWGPEDFESTEKLRFEDLGLTVKPLSYEIRRTYRLPDDAPGLVVAKIESGTPAAIAKMMPYEVLAEVDGKPVTDLEGFVHTVAAARESGAESIQFRLERMGKGRLVWIPLGD